MKLILFAFILMFCYQMQSQTFFGVIHYKIEGTSFSSSGKSYFVNTLTLKSDSSFKLQSLKFANKRERKKCIPNSIEFSMGYWSKNGDTIKCVIVEPEDLKNRIETFYLKGHNLYYFTFPVTKDFLKQRKKYPWKRVKSLNSDKFFK